MQFGDVRGLKLAVTISGRETLPQVEPRWHWNSYSALETTQAFTAWRSGRLRVFILRQDLLCAIKLMCEGQSARIELVDTVKVTQIVAGLGGSRASSAVLATCSEMASEMYHFRECDTCQVVRRKRTGKVIGVINLAQPITLVVVCSSDVCGCHMGGGLEWR